MAPQPRCGRNSLTFISLLSKQTKEWVHVVERLLAFAENMSFCWTTIAVRSIEILERDPGLGAVGGRVMLPDGREEASALPGVIISCGVCLRKEVLDRVGGFRPEFFRKAGEYDFSFRIWEAGYRVERFEDLVYRHDKALTNRELDLSQRMDLRNNLILAERFLPDDLRADY